jgi:hypothetical protein
VVISLFAIVILSVLGSLFKVRQRQRFPSYLSLSHLGLSVPEDEIGGRYKNVMD